MEFTCAHCGKVFEGGRTDDETRAETIDLFGVDPTQSPDDFAVICDDCFHPFKIWYEQKESELDRMRKMEGMCRSDGTAFGAAIADIISDQLSKASGTHAAAGKKELK